MYIKCANPFAAWYLIKFLHDYFLEDQRVLRWKMFNWNELPATCGQFKQEHKYSISLRRVPRLSHPEPELDPSQAGVCS